MYRYNHMSPGQVGFLRAVSEGPLGDLGHINQVYVRSALLRRWVRHDGNGHLYVTEVGKADLLAFEGATIRMRDKAGDVTEAVERLMKLSLKRAVAKKVAAA